ncbi:MAG: hypothetical protein AAGA66_10500, partial [Bacteroidota bacterium]
LVAPFRPGRRSMGTVRRAVVFRLEEKSFPENDKRIFLNFESFNRISIFFLKKNIFFQTIK